MEIIQLKQTDGDLSASIHKINFSNYCFKPIIGTDSMKIKRNVQVFDIKGKYNTAKVLNAGNLPSQLPSHAAPGGLIAYTFPSSTLQRDFEVTFGKTTYTNFNRYPISLTCYIVEISFSCFKRAVCDNIQES